MFIEQELSLPLNGTITPVLIVNNFATHRSINVYQLTNFYELGHVNFWPTPHYPLSEHIVQLSSLWVHDEYIGNRIGSTLIDAAKDVISSLHKQILVYPYPTGNFMSTPNTHGKYHMNKTDLYNFYCRHGFRILNTSEKELVSMIEYLHNLNGPRLTKLSSSFMQSYSGTDSLTDFVTYFFQDVSFADSVHVVSKQCGKLAASKMLITDIIE